MKKILAIAALAVRSAVRSRVVLCLLGVLALVIVCLPLTIKGDGTLEGYVQVLLGYTLSLSSLILALATVWAGCAAISGEISEKQIQLLATKPVSHLQIWLGKWLGLLFINALLLGLCGLTTYGLLRWNTRPLRLSEPDRTRLYQEVLVARDVIAPVQPDFDPEARRLLAEAQARGPLPAGTTPRQVLEEILRNLRLRAYQVPPGQTVSWLFHLPRRLTADDRLTLRFRYASSEMAMNPIEGLWHIGTPEKPRQFTMRQRLLPSARHDLLLPGGLVVTGDTAVVSFSNVHPEPLTLLFEGNEAVILLLPQGGFEENFARALLLILTRLALLAALGVTAGSLFSMPVACFISLYAVLLLSASGYVDSLAGSEVLFGSASGPPSVATRALNTGLRGLFTVMQVSLRPLEMKNPMEDLSEGRLIAWSRVGRAVGWQVILYGSLLAGLGTAALNRRELALPTS